MKIQLTILFVAMAFSLGVATASEVTGLTTFTSGTPAKASEVNDNFSAVKTAVDDNAADIATNAAALGATCGLYALQRNNGPTHCRTEKIVFVTSDTFAGDFGDFPLGGLSDFGADDRCQLAADRNPDLAGGVFRPWITNSGGVRPGFVDPIRGHTRAITAYVRVDGAVVANDWDDLVDGDLENPIDVTETGEVVAPSPVWTGVAATGGSTFVPICETVSGLSNGWSSQSGQGSIGDTAATDASWTEGGEQACSLQARLYCFQQ